MTSFGKYQVVELIGEGGFGRVYKGYDARLKRYVAIKTVSLAASQARERFSREAEIVANLHHPSIVTVYDFGEQDGVPYLVQEFLSGVDLSQLIERRETGTYATCVRRLIDVSEGLRFAHVRGVIHRDIKPANIRVLEDGSIRIMDFGIAKLLTSEQQITGTNMSVGTSGYVSPEQLEGRDIDHRADIFSFGTMAYELFTLRRPFEAETVPATLYRILTEDPQPIATLAPDCPPRLIACIDRCMRKNRDERFADCGQVIEELNEVLRELDRPAARAVSPAPAASGIVPAAALPGQPQPGPGAVPDQTAAAAIAGPGGGTGVQKAAIVTGAVALIAVLAWAASAVVGGLSSRSEDQRGRLGGAGSDSTVIDSTRIAGADSIAADSIGGVDDDSAVVVAGGGTGADTSGAGGAGGGRGGSGEGGSGTAGGRTGDAGGGRDAPVPVPPQVDPDRVLVLIGGARRDAIETAETMILRELRARGRPVVDPATLDRTRADAAAIAVEAGAGVVVVAELTADVTSAVAGFITGSAVLSARYYDSVSGELLLVESYQIGTGGTPGRAGVTEIDAITQATEAVARQMARAILQKTGTRQPRPQA